MTLTLVLGAILVVALLKIHYSPTGPYGDGGDGD